MSIIDLKWDKFYFVKKQIQNLFSKPVENIYLPIYEEICKKM